MQAEAMTDIFKVQAVSTGPGLFKKLGRVLREKASGDLKRVFKGTSKTREKLGVSPGMAKHGLPPEDHMLWFEDLSVLQACTCPSSSYYRIYSVLTLAPSSSAISKRHQISCMLS